MPEKPPLADISGKAKISAAWAMGLKRKTIWTIGLASGVPIFVGIYFLTRQGEAQALPFLSLAIVCVMMIAVAVLCGRIILDIVGRFSRFAGEMDDVLPKDVAPIESNVTGSVEDIIHRLRSSLEEIERKAKHLEDSNVKLQELDRMKSEFLSSISHELRTPLTSIRSFSEILMNYPDEEIETRIRFLKIINSECERLTSLINNVLDLAKIEAGRIVWNMSVCLLEDVLDRSVAVAQGLEGEKKLRIVLERPEAMPAFFGDRDRIQQVCLNLLGNAVKFSPEKSEIRVCAGAEGTERLWFSVADKGPGIPVAEQGRLFQKFEQIQEPGASKPSGTGLGLAISKEIVEIHGGRIEVQTEEGKGTTFRVLLPVWREESEFKTTLGFWIRQAIRRGFPLSILMLGAEGGKDPVDFARRLKNLLLRTVRSPSDAVVLHDRPGHAVVFSFSHIFAMDKIRERAMDRISKGEFDFIPESARSIRYAVAEYPKDSEDAQVLAGLLERRLQGKGIEMQADKQQARG